MREPLGPKYLGTRIVNKSGILHVNKNVTLCRDTYYLQNSTDTFGEALLMNSSNIYLDCNGSILDGIYGLGTGILVTAKENVTIENCTVRLYYLGFNVQSSSSNTRFAYDNALSNWHGFQGDDSQGTLFFNCTASGNLDGFHVDTCHNNVFLNDTANGNSNSGFVVQSSNNPVLGFNLAYGNLYGFVIYDNVYYGIVENNTARNNLGVGIPSGFYIYNSDSNNLSRNFAYNNSDTGIGLADSDLNTLSYNSAYNNTQHGFEADSTSNSNTFIGNNASNNTQSGFYLDGSYQNNFANTISRDNRLHGFHLLNNADQNTFNSTQIYNNIGDGVYIDGSNNNIFQVVTSSFNNNSFELSNSDINYMYNATSIDENDNGFYIHSGSDYNRIIDGSAISEISSGVYIGGSWSSIITNFAASQNFYGIYLSSSLYNTISNVSGSGNTYGIEMDSSSSNSLTNVAFSGGSTDGFYVSAGSSSNNFTNITSYNYGGYGFEIYQGSSNNNFTNLVAYNNSGYGIYIWFVSTAPYNFFTNAFIYNQSNYLYVSSAAAQNNFTNLTLGYTNAIGLVNYPFLNLTSVNLYTNEGSLPSGTIILRSDWVSLDDANAVQANAIANITISTTNCSYPVKIRTGFPTTLSDILTNGVIYPTDKTCLTPTIALFNVTGFSGFALGQTPTLLTLTMLPSGTVTYKTQTNVSCNASNSEVLISLYNNASGSMALVAGPATSYIQYLTNHSAGFYNYTCNTSGDANYTGANISGLLTVNRNTSTCSLNILPGSPQTYGTPITATCSCTSLEASATLWRNNTNVTATENGVATVIPGGTWNYTCNVTQTENYTSASNSQLYTINPATTSITSFTATPVPATVGNETNVSCSASNGEVILGIYVNGTLVQSGTGSIEYLANLSAGSYEFICNTSGNENYTGAAGTPIYYTVNQITTTLTLTATPGWTVTPGTTTNVSCDASNGVVLISLYRDGVPIDSDYGHVEEVAALALGSYVYVCNTTGAENYTSATSTNTLNVRRPSEGAPGECALSIVMDREIPVGAPADIEIRRSTGTNPSNALVEIWKNVAGAVHEEFHTDGSGHITFTPDETGSYTIAAFLSGCTDADGTFSVYAPTGEVTATFEPFCNGSVVTVLQTVCTGGATDGGGFLECRDVPVEGALVSVYRCQEDWETAGAPENTCSELIGTYTTDANGEAVTDARDGHVRIVADLRVASHFVGTTIYGDLPESAQCPPPAQQLMINFDPSCQGSTITVTTTQCIQQDISGAPPICTEVPVKGASVEIYCCPSLPAPGTPTSAVGCTLADSGATSSSGTFITNARDCEASINVRSDSASASTTATLPSTQDCVECIADSDCLEGYVCRENQCVPFVIPPDQRRCSSNVDCTHGYRCSGGMCTQIISCATDQNCPAAQGCLDGVCYTQEEIQEIRGGEGVEGEGGLPAVLGGVFNAIVRSAWLIILIILLLLLFWFFYWKRRRKKKPLTQEEMIAKEQEFGGKPAPPRPPRTPPRR